MRERLYTRESRRIEMNLKFFFSSSSFIYLNVANLLVAEQNAFFNSYFGIFSAYF